MKAGRWRSGRTETGATEPVFKATNSAQKLCSAFRRPEHSPQVLKSLAALIVAKVSKFRRFLSEVKSARKRGS